MPRNEMTTHYKAATPLPKKQKRRHTLNNPGRERHPIIKILVLRSNQIHQQTTNGKHSQTIWPMVLRAQVPPPPSPFTQSCCVNWKEQINESRVWTLKLLIIQLVHPILLNDPTINLRHNDERERRDRTLLPKPLALPRANKNSGSARNYWQSILPKLNHKKQVL